MPIKNADITLSSSLTLIAIPLGESYSLSYTKQNTLSKVTSENPTSYTLIPTLCSFLLMPAYVQDSPRDSK